MSWTVADCKSRFCSIFALRTDSSVHRLRILLKFFLSDIVENEGDIKYAIFKFCVGVRFTYLNDICSVSNTPVSTKNSTIDLKKR